MQKNILSPNAKRKGKCWFYENGFCRKGAQGVQCPFSHPQTMCTSFWNHGECPQGDKCPKRHPAQVCIKYLNNTCINGVNCVYQHPQNSISSKPMSPQHQSSPQFYGNQNKHFPPQPSTSSNVPSSSPSYFPTSANYLPAQSHQPGRQQQEHQRDHYDQQQHHQGNDHGHLGQQQGQGWL